MPLRWILGLALLYNAVVFGVYGWDKREAQKGGWRVSEAHLLWLAAVGGGPGAWLGMNAFHHKTHKLLFAWGVPLLTVGQVALLVWLFTR